ncbi:MAG: HDOD domain-containing protein [Sulfurimonas sp.]|jgi:HD-like signal output (HDOD) protein
MNFESIISTIRSLPPLPKSVVEIQKLYVAGDPDINLLVKIIEADPILTSDILAEANSPLHSFSKKIIAVQQVITLLGTSAIRSLALASSTQKNFKLNFQPYGLSNAEYSNMCNLQSMLMFQWYMGVDISKSKILIPLVFLSEMGKILIANELNDSEYATIFQKEIKESDNISEVERMYAGTTTTTVNILLYKHWNFDEMFIDIMEYLENPCEEKSYLQEYANAIQVVHTAVNVNNLLTVESIQKATLLAESFGYDSARFEKTAKRIKQKLEEANLL